MSIQINTHGLFTPREEDVFKYIAEGKSILQAARLMRISRKVTYRYVEHAKDKLNAETTPHAISLLWTQGHIKNVACLMLGLFLWLPIADSIVDQNTAIARRGAGGKARRTGRSKTEGGLFTIDPDTGELCWPAGLNMEHIA
ncbi:MAG: response regulator transcription factor [Candidatus Reddybacter sp.]